MMRQMSIEEACSPNPTLPLMAAIGFHALLFVLNPTILQRGTAFPELPPMVIKMADALPVMVPAPPIPKPEVVKPPKPKPVPKKKKGLAPKMQPPKPKPVMAKPKVMPVARHTFISKVDLPKFRPRDTDEVLAASSVPGMAPAAKQRMTQAPTPAPMLHVKTHGIAVDEIHFKLSDRSGLSTPSMRAVAIPVAEQHGDIPVLPASVLHNAPKGISQAGYRYKPQDGVGELAGINKTGYHGVTKADRYTEGDLSATAASTAKTIKGNGFEITGAIGDRKILSRAIPQYPAWAEEQGITASVQVYFTVRPDGSIRSNLRIQRSSGYSELDQLAKEALLKWKFSPAAGNDESVSWGVITFRFTLN